METIKKDQKRNFANTISAGLKSFGTKGKTFYVLEFKTNTQLHRSNTSKEIIVDYIEIGRSPKCQVRFGEDSRLVSGIHCAIIKEGEDYFLKHLSKTNPTLINGKPVADKWYLNSGDEIQLSYEGPIIGFIIPANNLTGSIPLTRRLGLFKDQALKPYKTAIASLASILLLVILGFGLYAYNSNQSLDSLTKKNKITELEVAALKLKNDSSSKVINELSKKVKNLSAKPPRGPVANPPNGNPPADGGFELLHPGIYYITATKVEINIQGEMKERAGDWTGTGFLLSDGKFITARHVINPWFFVQTEEDDYFIENLVASNGGTVMAYFTATSSDGTVFKFKSSDFNFNKANDNFFKHKSDSGELIYTKARSEDDWASVQTSSKGLLESGTQYSNSLKAGDKLFHLGFPYGWGVDKNGVEPLYSDFTVSRQGVHDGFITISGKSWENGSSGGPVFFKAASGFKVIGLVSASRGAQGIIIPISKIR